MEDGYLYLRLRNMSHTIYVAKFEQTTIHQHVHLRRKSQSHAPGACANEIIPNRKLVRLFTKRKKDVMLELLLYQYKQNNGQELQYFAHCKYTSIRK